MKKLLSLIFLVLTVTQVHSQWVGILNQYGNMKVRSYFSSNNYVLCGSDLGLWVSINSGSNWNGPYPLPSGYVWSTAVIGNDFLAGIVNQGVYLSKDHGSTWIYADSGIGSYPVLTFVVSGSVVYAGTQGGGIFESTDTAAHWFSINNGFLNGVSVPSILINGSYIFAACTGAGIFRTSNNGTSWTQIDTGIESFHTVYAIAPAGSNIIIGTISGIYLSTNNGDSWIDDNIGIPTTEIYKMAISGNIIIAGGYVGVGIYATTNEGSNWYSINEGLPDIPDMYIDGLGANSIYFFAGPQLTTDGYGIWRRLASSITGVGNTNTQIPERFALYQNYPNPFNPSTKIKFDIAPLLDQGGVAPTQVGDGVVTLKIYDVLGREVTTLVNQQLQPGTYSIQWNASNYPSGVYFYKLVTVTYTAVKKMILLK